MFIFRSKPSFHLLKPKHGHYKNSFLNKSKNLYFFHTSSHFMTEKISPIEQTVNKHFSTLKTFGLVLALGASLNSCVVPHYHHDNKQLYKQSHHLRSLTRARGDKKHSMYRQPSLRKNHFKPSKEYNVAKPSRDHKVPKHYFLRTLFMRKHHH